MSIIKAGYKITVESWENDADNYRTESIDGIQDKEYVQFLVEFMQLFESHHNSKFGIGNMYDPDEKELEKYENVLKELCEKYDAGKWFKDPQYVQGFEPHQYLSDIRYDLHGSSSEGFFTRVTESIVVEYTPTDIVLEDVTKQFVGV